MISFIFRTLFMLFVVGLIMGLYFSVRSRTTPLVVSKDADERVITEDARARPIIVDENHREGPAEKVGAVVDDLLHSVGKVAERAGEGLQEATDDDRKDR